MMVKIIKNCYYDWILRVWFQPEDSGDNQNYPANILVIHTMKNKKKFFC